MPKPVARFVYVSQLANPATGTQPAVIQGYRVEAATGALTPVGPTVDAPTNPLAMRVLPSGRFLLCLGNIAGEVAVYAIDAQTGVLTRVATARAGGASPVLTSLVLDPSGRWVFASELASGNTFAWAVDDQTGALTPLPGSPFTLQGAATGIDALGQFLYAVDASAGLVTPWAIDRNTGSLSAVANNVTAFDVAGFVAEPLGRYVYTLHNSGGQAGMGTVQSWRPEATRGLVVTQAVNWTDSGFSPTGGAAHPAGARLYTSHLQGSIAPGSQISNPFGGAYGPYGVWWYEIQPSGVLSLRGGVQVDYGTTAIDCEQGGRFLFAASYTQSPSNGALQVIQLDAGGDPIGVVQRVSGLSWPSAVASAP